MLWNKCFFFLLTFQPFCTSNKLLQLDNNLGGDHVTIKQPDFFFFFVHIDLAAADVFESSVEKERRVDNCSNTGVTDALFDYKQRFIVQHLLIQLDQRQYLSIVSFSSCILFDVRLLMKAT